MTLFFLIRLKGTCKMLQYDYYSFKGELHFINLIVTRSTGRIEGGIEVRLFFLSAPVNVKSALTASF